MIKTSNNGNGEILSGPERWRRWSPVEKLALVQEIYEPDMTVSLVARRHGIAPNQLFLWRKLAAQGALKATRAEEEVVPASEYRFLVNQVRELQRLLGKKTLETEILKEALEQSQGQKNICCTRSHIPRELVQHRSGRKEVQNEDRLRHPACCPLEHCRTPQGPPR